MKRREFIAASAVLLVSPRRSLAQGKPRRIGFLGAWADEPARDPLHAAWLNGLREKGWIEGKNLLVEYRFASDRLPALAAELVALTPELVVALGPNPALALKSATTTIPIVFVAVYDPVAIRLVQSLSRPGGNITGISDDAAVLTTKRLSLLKHLQPNLRRVAILWNRDDQAMMLRYETSAKAAQTLGITVQTLAVQERDDFNGVLATMDSDPPEAILMVSDSLTDSNRKRVFDYTLAKRIPAIYESDPLVRDGGLMSYGSDPKESFERAADFAARIFKGARPGDLPFERPTRYPFVINLKTAKAMNLDIPATLTALADEVIE